jgi:hypothetical protein
MREIHFDIEYSKRKNEWMNKWKRRREWICTLIYI